MRVESDRWIWKQLASSQRRSLGDRTEPDDTEPNRTTPVLAQKPGTPY